MYINGAAAVQPNNYVKLIKETDCNAVVIDIKDGYLAYQSEVAKELSPASYKSAYVSAEDYKKGVEYVCVSTLLSILTLPLIIFLASIIL